MNVRVLIVEDDVLLALDIAAQLSGSEFTVVGTPTSVAGAFAILDQPTACDVAVLDVNLGRETSEPIAHRLILEGTPFLVVSGYAATQHPIIFQGVPALTKPVRPEQLLAELRKLCSCTPSL
jgi:DNA-binding response OmpR family regulator